MTPREAALLEFVGEYVTEHGYSPSYAECATDLGIASKAGVLRMVTSLVSQGRLIRRPYRSRSLEVVNVVAPPLNAALAREITDAIVADHGVFEDDEHPDKLVVCTPDELWATIVSLVAK